MEEHRVKLQSFINGYINKKEEIDVLEAGCGSRNNFSFPAETVRFTGMDISEKQLGRNKNLDKKILGDLQTYDLGENVYDIIMCWNVLEHLENPGAALKNFLNAIKEDGMIIIGIPNVMSFKGLVTKYFPHSFHLFFYRYIMGRKTAGKNDIGPFKTYLKYDISKKNIEKFAEINSAKVIYFDEWDAADLDYYLNKNFISRTIKSLYKLAKLIIYLLTFGMLGDSEIIFILKKK